MKRGLVMSYESFAKVFAPSSETVISQRDSHWEKAKGLMATDVMLALGMITCFVLLFGDFFGDFFAKELVSRLLLYGALLLLGLLVICAAVTWWHLRKASRLEQELESGYILSGQYSQKNFYY